MPQRINVSDFNLAATLECGQAFRWQRAPDGWFVGVVGRRVLRLRQNGNSLEGDIMPDYLGLDVSLPEIVATFPGDEALQLAVKQYWGLRVMRQEPWECLASFITSSTKQIVQIRQIVANLARCFGEPIDGHHHAFPTAEAVARATVQQLWDCKLGFRAKYLHAAARHIADGQLDFATLRRMEYERALEELLKLSGAGEKIANCTLLFSCRFEQAFPVDVWMERALRRLAFHGRKVSRYQLQQHFGPYGGWAQQYLFISERNRSRAVQ